MTRAIIENILTIEKKADDLVARAKADTLKLQGQTEQEISKLKAAFKQEAREKTVESHKDTAAKVEKLKDKLDKELKEDLKELAALVKKNHTKTKKFVLQKLLHD